MILWNAKVNVLWKIPKPKGHVKRLREKVHFLSRCKIEGCNSGFTTKQCLQFHYKKTHKLEETAMPKIVREIPYTLSAYSGGCVSSSSTASEDETSEANEDGPTKADPTQSSQTSPMETYISKYSSKKLSERYMQLSYQAGFRYSQRFYFFCLVHVQPKCNFTEIA